MLSIIMITILVNYALAFRLRKDYVYRRLVLVVLLIINIGTLLLFQVYTTLYSGFIRGRFNKPFDYASDVFRYIVLYLHYSVL